MGKNKNILIALSVALIINTILGGVAQALPGDPSFRGTSGYGLNLQGMSNNPAIAELRLPTAAKELNLGYIRLSASWADIEATDGNYSWTELDAQIALANKYNLRVLLIPYETPSWARPVGAPTNWDGAKYPPADSQDYADFMTALVTRYAPQGVLDYEIWNEPNLDRFWKDTLSNPKPNVEHYVELLSAAYTAAHDVNDNVNIIAGSLSPAGDLGDGTTIAPMTFLEQMYAEGAKNYFDSLSFHPYSFPDLPSTDVNWNAWQIMSKVYGSQQSLRSVMTANNDSSKKIWLTEFGAPTDGYSAAVSEAQHAAIMEEAIQLHASYDWVGPLFFYDYRDTEPPVNDTSPTAPDREPWFGMYRYDGTAKPAAAAMRAVMPANGQLRVSANGTLLQDNTTLSSNQLLEGVASSYATISVLVDNTEVCVTMANAVGEWSCIPTSTLSDGSHQLLVRATNVNGTIQEQGAFAIYVGDQPANPVDTSTPATGSTGAGENVTNSGSASSVPGAPNTGAQRIHSAGLLTIIALALMTGLTTVATLRHYRKHN